MKVECAAGIGRCGFNASCATLNDFFHQACSEAARGLLCRSLLANHFVAVHLIHLVLRPLLLWESLLTVSR